MTKGQYERIFQKILSVKYGVALLQISGKVLVYTTALAYFAAVAGSSMAGEWKEAVVLVLVPAISFLLVSMFRSHYKTRRPYEIYGFQPLIPKETKGKSFPSRHVFSIFVIGSTLFWVAPIMGILICCMGCLLAVQRVAAGVHFPVDVLAGAAIGMLCGGVAGIVL